MAVFFTSIAVSRSLVRICLAAIFATSVGLAAERPQAGLRTLTTSREAHSLTLDEAGRSYPVRLKAVVTYYDPYIDTRPRAALFVHDSTGSIFIAVFPPLASPVSAGALVEVIGTSGRGDFAPIVNALSVREIGKSHVPSEAPRVTLTRLRKGEYDGQWVEVEGVVHSALTYGKNVNLRIALADGFLNATTVKEEGTDYGKLVDARVLIHASAAPVFNHHLQMTGARLFFPDLGQVRILEPPPADPFALPLTRVDLLLRFVPHTVVDHRVHLRGRVSLYWPGRSLCIQDGSRGICVQTSQATPLGVGQVVDVIGFPEIGGLNPSLTNAAFRPAGAGQPLTASRVSAEQAMQGEEDSRLVEMEGTLIGKDRAANDPTMILASGKFLFPVVLPERFRDHGMPSWEEGSVLRVVGICSVQLLNTEAIREGSSAPSSFRVLLRSPQDVTVLKKPSWWTATHLLPLLAVFSAVTLCVLAWVTALRHRVAEQSTIIRAHNAALQELSLRDGLTGIANRRSFDETLKAESEKALRSESPLSLVMIDIDHFKSLNDRYGHQFGDDCLIRVASTLTSSLRRKAGFVARFGGEEFSVILPDCGEEDAVAVAERMRSAVFDLAIAHRGSTFSYLSISVGVATLPSLSAMVPRVLVAMADSALYDAKALGRNTTAVARSSASTPAALSERVQLIGKV